MKKHILIVLTLFMVLLISRTVCALPAEEFPVTNGNTEVVNVLAAQRKQQHPTFSTKADSLDTIWILFGNGDFRQFVIMDQEFRMFSCGTFTPVSANEFLINRTQKYMEGAGFQNYSSVHEYRLKTEEYTPLLSPEKKDHRVTAVFGGVERQPYTDQDKQEILLDTYWIFYSDDTFEQYAALGTEFCLYRSGTCSYPEENMSDPGSCPEPVRLFCNTDTGEIEEMFIPGDYVTLYLLQDRLFLP